MTIIIVIPKFYRLTFIHTKESTRLKKNERFTELENLLD